MRGIKVPFVPSKKQSSWVVYLGRGKHKEGPEHLTSSIVSRLALVWFFKSPQGERQ